MDNLPRRVWLRDAAGEPIDEAMACREHDGVLITCHGGAAVRRALEAELQAAGLEPAGHQPFGTGVFATRTLGLLPNAQGEGAAALLLQAARQAHALRRALDEPAGLPALLAESEAARYLFTPPRVQLWGPVNAGKSSLLNALCGEALAAVGPEPGLTRDVIEGRFEHEGFVIRLFDAPGSGADGDLDAQAVRLAETWRREADLTLELGDGGEDTPTRWRLRSRADDGEGISVRRPATLEALKDRLLEHFFGRLQSLPAERRFALHPELREALANQPEAARGWLD